MQLAAANRYIYQHPRTARDKYALVFREYYPRSLFLSAALAKLRRWFSRPRGNDGMKKRAKRAALEL